MGMRSSREAALSIIPRRTIPPLVSFGDYISEYLFAFPFHARAIRRVYGLPSFRRIYPLTPFDGAFDGPFHALVFKSRRSLLLAKNRAGRDVNRSVERARRVARCCVRNRVLSQTIVTCVNTHSCNSNTLLPFCFNSLSK